MFYTNVPATDLKAACDETLQQHDIHADTVMIAASNTALSPFNYTIWHQGEAGTHAFERMVVFGDSLSDTQNIYSLTLHAAPAKGSWFLGRFSNGPVWTEYLAKAADLPLYTWAVGSAGTDQHLILPGFPQQVDSWRSYMTAAEHYDPSGTLFLALFGGNDFINYDVTPAAALEAVTRGIDKLLAAGATRIVIGNLPDVTRAPIFKWRDDAVTVAARVRQYNAGLASLIAQRHDSRLTLFDAAAFFDTILRSPGRFGFTDIDTSCLRMDTSSLWAYRAEQQRRPGCDPEHFLFWDTLHPTSRLHQLMGEAALKAIPELSQHQGTSKKTPFIRHPGDNEN
ncbi:MAG TPA: SGNH/GDSL hydrolase family protein [Dyella sp.]|uniref:SGNH/GDSL hydrolase family protein n=1 Tax=Dyella sp. TaxID=1869338 RepID=UPI002F92F63F